MDGIKYIKRVNNIKYESVNKTNHHGCMDALTLSVLQNVITTHVCMLLPPHIAINKDKNYGATAGTQCLWPVRCHVDVT